MAIEIVDLHIYKLKIIIFHSYVNVYQRVSKIYCWMGFPTTFRNIQKCLPVVNLASSIDVFDCYIST
jgi:hypothetical protein